MTKPAETVDRPAEANLETRLPVLIDQTLAQLTQVGVQRILQLAGEMAQARLDEPLAAHLAPPRSAGN